MPRTNSRKYKRPTLFCLTQIKRAHYDRFGHDGPAGNPFGGFSGGGFNINLEDLLGGDFFSGFFGGGRGRSRDRRGSDILVRHSIELATVLTGSDESIELDLPAECTTCSGTGAKDGKTTTCPRCQGQGRVRVRQQIGPFVNEVVQDCPECGGSGSIIESPCEDCSGRGYRNERRPFDSLCHLVQSTVLVYDCVVKVNPQSVVEAHQAIF